MVEWKVDDIATKAEICDHNKRQIELSLLVKFMSAGSTVNCENRYRQRQMLVN